MVFECQPDITVNHRGGYREPTHTDVLTHAHTHTLLSFCMFATLILFVLIVSQHTHTHTLTEIDIIFNIISFILKSLKDPHLKDYLMYLRS